VSGIVDRLRDWSEHDEGKINDAREEAAAAIEHLRSENVRFRAALKSDDQTLRLHLGEMTAQEMRTLRAGFMWVLARAVVKGDA
jgi:hypothetical protein